MSLAKGWIDVDEDGIKLRPLARGIFVQPNSIYYIGASSSPDMCIVTNVTDTQIEYYKYPYERALRIERDIGEDLMMRGCKTWMEQHKDYMSYPWMPRTYAHLREALSGKPSDYIVSLHDFQMTEIEVALNEEVYSRELDYWRVLEEYGSVGGINPPNYNPKYPIDRRLQRFVVKLSNGELKRLKNDKRFKIIREVKENAGA